MPVRKRYAAFVGTRMLASGSLREVALAVERHAARGEASRPLVFDEATGLPTDLDRRGGRRRLGGVARGGTLLPPQGGRVNAPPGGASGALRPPFDQTPP